VPPVAGKSKSRLELGGVKPPLRKYPGWRRRIHQEMPERELRRHGGQKIGLRWLGGLV
jgi:hypothetical protein